MRTCRGSGGCRVCSVSKSGGIKYKEFGQLYYMKEEGSRRRLGRRVENKV